MDEQLAPRRAILFDWSDTLARNIEPGVRVAYDETARFISDIRIRGFHAFLATRSTPSQFMTAAGFRIPEDIYSVARKHTKAQAIAHYKREGYDVVAYVGDRGDDVKAPAEAGTPCVLFFPEINRSDITHEQRSRVYEHHKMASHNATAQIMIAYGFDELEIALAHLAAKASPSVTSPSESTPAYSICLGPFPSRVTADHYFEEACHQAELYLPGTSPTRMDNRYSNGVITIDRVNDLASDSVPGIVLSTLVDDERLHLLMHSLVTSAENELCKHLGASTQGLPMNIPVSLKLHRQTPRTAR